MKRTDKIIKYQKAKGLLSRLKGLIGKENFLPFLISECRAIHTFGMKVPLDLIWINKNFEVVQIDKNVKKRNFKFCKKAQHILECESGFIEKEKISIGNILKLVLENKTEKKNKNNFFQKFCRDESGQALVETAFVLPILLTIVFAFIQLGLAIHERQKLTYVVNYSTQTGSLTNNKLKITGAVEEFYTAGDVIVNIQVLDKITQNLKNNSAARYKDILSVELKKKFNLKIPFLTISVLNLKAKASARILCPNLNPPYTCL